MRNRDPRDIRTAPPAVFLLCHTCGTRIHSADHFCRRCGHSLLRLEETVPRSDFGPPGRPRPGIWRALATLSPSARTRGFRALVTAVVFIATLATTIPLPEIRTAEMAGVRIGDTVQRVEGVLGRPHKGPVSLTWKPDHDVKMLQYDLDMESGGIPNLSVTLVDDKVWRVASLHKRYSTRDGLRVGDTLEKARKIYGTGIEEDSDAGLVPWKFVCQGQVVKVIVEHGGKELLAVGIETPLNFKLMAPPPWFEDRSEPPLPGDAGDTGENRLL